MDFRIRAISKQDSKKGVAFSKREWAIVNKRRNQLWKIKKKCFVAYDKDRVIGIARLEIIGGAAYLDDFIVSKDGRNRGVGTALIKKFEGYAKRVGCHVACVETNGSLPGAIAFYRKLNYRVEASMKDNRFHTTVIFMKKRLR